MSPEVSRDGLGLEEGGDRTGSSSIQVEQPVCAEGACNINGCIRVSNGRNFRHCGKSSEPAEPASRVDLFVRRVGQSHGGASPWSAFGKNFLFRVF